MPKLDKEFNYYLANQNELVKKYNGRTLVIMGEKVIADYADDNEAYFEAEKKYGLGNFLLQKCTPGEEAYSVIFHSMVGVI